MAIHTPLKTTIARGKVAGIVHSYNRGASTLRAYSSSAPSTIPPSDTAQLNLIAGAEAWLALTQDQRDEWNNIGALQDATLSAGGSGYTSPPQLAHLFSSYGATVTAGGAGYPESASVQLADYQGNITTFYVIAPGGVPIQFYPPSAKMALQPVSATIVTSSGSGLAVNFLWDPDTTYATLEISTAGSGYPDLAVYQTGYASPVGTAVVTSGVVTFLYVVAPATWTGTTEPAIALAASSGTGAKIAAQFFDGAYTLPSYATQISGGAVSAIQILDHGINCYPLPPLQFSGGGGSGASATFTQPWIAPTTTNSAGQVTNLSGYTAFMACWQNLLNFPNFALVDPPHYFPEPASLWGLIAQNTGTNLYALVPNEVYDYDIHFSLSSGGAGYTANFPCTTISSSGHGLQLLAIVNAGAVVDVITIDPGYGYGGTDPIDFSAGDGTGAAGTATYPAYTFSFLFYAEKPAGLSQFSTAPTGFQYVGQLGSDQNNVLDFTAAYTAIFGSVPPPTTPFNVKMVPVLRQGGSAGKTLTRKCLPNGALDSITGYNAPPGYTGPLYCTFARTGATGAEVQANATDGIVTTAAITSYGSGVSETFEFYAWDNQPTAYVEVSWNLL